MIHNSIRSALLALVLGAAAAGQELLQVHSGQGAGDRFGRVHSAGDIDEDGLPDLVVGAPHDGAGSVTVVSGAGGATLFVLQGAANGDLYGWSCSAAGDCNADGRADLVIGAPAGGYVRIVSGADGSTIRTLTGPASAQFGFAVDGAGDADADGKDDVLVGAPDDDVGGADTGSVFLISGADGGTLHAAAGSSPGDRLGHSVSGTVCGENEPDVVIGASQGGNGPGYIQVRRASDFLIEFTRVGQGALAGDVDADGSSDVLAAAAGDVRVYSGGDGALLLSVPAPGARAFALGDVNGDGSADLALSDAGGGTVRIVSGSDGKVLHELHGPASGAAFGESVADAGDLDADGLADFAIGAPCDDVGGADSGSVVVLSMTRWENVGNGLPGMHGIPHLRGTGGLVAQTEVQLILEFARGISGATLVMGSALVVDTAQGVLVPTPDIVTTGLMTNVQGGIDVHFTWPTGLPSGFTAYYQFRITDSEGPSGESRSNTLAALVP